MEAKAGATFPLRFDLIGGKGQVLHTSEFVKEKIVIGRILSADLRIDSPVVSRIHALVEVRGETVLLTDLASTHGTFVNGERIVEARIKPGDSVRLGTVELRIAKGSGTATTGQPELGSGLAEGAETQLDIDRGVLDQLDRRGEQTGERRKRDAFPDERRLDERRTGDRRIEQRGGDRRAPAPGVSAGGAVETEADRRGGDRRTPIDFERRVGERRQGDRRIFDITSLERRIEDRRGRRDDDDMLPGELEKCFTTPKHPRELEVTVLWGDYILDVSNYYKPMTLNVGEAPQNDYIIPSEGIPEEFPLVEIEDESNARLSFTDDMTGTVRARDRMYKLEDLRDEKFVKREGSRYYLPLKQDDFAKLAIGGINFFILYVKPAPRIKAQPFLEQDPLLLRTLIGSAIFLALFIVLGMVAPEPKPVQIEQIPERYAKIIIKKKPEVKKVEEQKVSAPKLEEKKKDAKEAKPVSKQEKKVENEKKAKATGLLKAFSQNSKMANMLNSNPLSGGFEGFGKALPGTQGKMVFGAAGGVKGVNLNNGGGTIGIDGPTTKGLGGGSPFGGLSGLGGKGEHAVGIVSENVQVLSGLPKDVINSVVQRHRAEIRNCYDSALRRNPNLRGKVVVAFSISAAGQVTYAGVKETTLNDSGLENCVLARVRSWTFPKPEAPIVTEVSAYPFYLNPAN